MPVTSRLWAISQRESQQHGRARQPTSSLTYLQRHRPRPQARRRRFQHHLERQHHRHLCHLPWQRCGTARRRPRRRHRWYQLLQGRHELNHDRLQLQLIFQLHRQECCRRSRSSRRLGLGRVCCCRCPLRHVVGSDRMMHAALLDHDTCNSSSLFWFSTGQSGFPTSIAQSRSALRG